MSVAELRVLKFKWKGNLKDRQKEGKKYTKKYGQKEENK
jgi:hypothetical protein